MSPLEFGLSVLGLSAIATVAWGYCLYSFYSETKRKRSRPERVK